MELADPSPDKLAEAVRDADALVVRMRAHVTARIIENAPKLRVIGRAGASLDHIDVRAALKRNITVVHAPTAAVRSVAEFAVALMLACLRRITWYDRRVREGQFESLRAPYGHEFRHLTIGLLGDGPVADEVARICHDGFGATQLAHVPDAAEPVPSGATPVSLAELLSRSDALSIHISAGERWNGLVGVEQLARMKPSAVLVNTSRGNVVDNAALAEALKTHRLAGAAIDVFDAEPPGAEHPLRNAPNCILTPHIAAATQDVTDGYFGLAESNREAEPGSSSASGSACRASRQAKPPGPGRRILRTWDSVESCHDSRSTARRSRRFRSQAVGSHSFLSPRALAGRRQRRGSPWLADRRLGPRNGPAGRSPRYARHRRIGASAG